MDQMRMVSYTLFCLCTEIKFSFHSTQWDIFPGTSLDSCGSIKGKCICKYKEYSSGCLQDETPVDLVDNDPIRANNIHLSIVNGSLDSALKLLKDSSHDNEEEMEPNYNPIVYKNSTVTFTALDAAAYNGHIEIVLFQSLRMVYCHMPKTLLLSWHTLCVL